MPCITTGIYNLLCVSLKLFACIFYSLNSIVCAWLCKCMTLFSWEKHKYIYTLGYICLVQVNTW